MNPAFQSNAFQSNAFQSTLPWTLVNTAQVPSWQVVPTTT